MSKVYFPMITMSAKDQTRKFGEVIITPDTEMNVTFFKSGYTTDAEDAYPKTELPKEAFIHNFANKLMYTDVVPFEIVKYNTPTKLTIREMDAELDPEWKMDVSIGGFVGHVNNNHTQKYSYESNENADIREIRYSKKNKIWKDKYGNRYGLSSSPIKHYDYNF